MEIEYINLFDIYSSYWKYLLINASLLTACFPNEWKIAEVKPIHKEMK